jgi:hypothetical protein
MRYVFLTMTLAGAMYGQAIMDASAAAAGGIVGGASGKQVSDGVTGIFGKVAKQTTQAAGDSKAKPVAVTPAAAPAAAPILEIGPGVPKSGGVPLPPAVPHKVALAKPAPPPAPEPVAVPEPVAPPPPPPEMTSDDLKKVAAGMNREDLLKLGAPGSRIAMSDDGHLQETFHYYAHGGDSMIGTVRLVDGSVSTVQVN